MAASRKRAAESDNEEDAKRAREDSSSSEESLPEPEFDPSDYFQLSVKYEKEWKRGPVNEKAYKIDITKEPESADQDPEVARAERLLLLVEILEAAFRKIMKQAPPDSVAQVYMSNTKMDKACISTCRRAPADITFEHLTDILGDVLKSDESVNISDSTFILSTFIPRPTVGGRGTSCRSRHEYSKDVWLRSKHSMYDPMHSRNRVPSVMQDQCVALVLVKELFALQNPDIKRSKMRDYLRNRENLAQVFKLLQEAGLDPTKAPYTLEQLPSFAKCLPKGVGLNFYDDAAPPFLQIGPRRTRTSINIFINYQVQEDGHLGGFHAHGINSMNSFFGTRQFCNYCFKGYNTRTKHKCPEASCQLCKYMECKNTQNERKAKIVITCEDCNLYFHTRECYAAHTLTCGDLVRCKYCALGFSKGELKTHKCATPYCQKCLQEHSPFDFCYVPGAKKKAKKEKKKKPIKIWYADSETQVHPETKQHTANLVILQNQDNTKTYTYKGPDAMLQFTKACMDKKTPFKDSTIVFHNGSGFDAHLWYRELWNPDKTQLTMGCPPKKMIRKQQKIIGMELAQNGIKCRDSLQFIPGTPLSAFPKTFGLQSGPKGDFPHGLNTPEWVQFGEYKTYREVVDGVEHRFPLLHYFWPKHKRQAQLKTLKAWHQEQVAKYAADPGLVYCPEEELIKYCEQDVRILREGFEKYRQTWLDQYQDLEPLDNLTFPSYNNRIFREKYMPPKSLCMLPPQGYERANQPTSKEANAWLAWQERQLKLTELRTARKHYEVKVAGHRVDGAAVDSSGHRHILQFHGCYWHGHDCHTDRTEILDIRKEYTKNVDHKFKSLAKDPNFPHGPFTYHTIFECQFKAQVKKPGPMRSFVLDYYRQFSKDALKLREALRGGRTNAIRHRIPKVPPGWKLYYVDFTSLYPAVNFGINGEVWPLGHPDIFIGKDMEMGPQDPKDWFGYAKVTVLPPRNLKHPVLGQLINDKLLFHLCTSCATELHQGPCQHTDSQRGLTGTFFTGELQLAMEMGYKITRVHELWNWPKERQSSTLFKGLILEQYAKKALSSAVPKDPAQLLELIKEYADTMDLHLAPEDFQENKALRALAKFSLNNIW